MTINITIDDKKIEYFHQNTVFCFTSDIDWAPEWAIKYMLDFFEKKNIPLTLFITHDSPIIKKKIPFER